VKHNIANWKRTKKPSRTDIKVMKLKIQWLRKYSVNQFEEKNSMNRFNSRLDKAKETINKLEDGKKNIFQSTA
jgi:hypothetical protein